MEHSSVVEILLAIIAVTLIVITVLVASIRSILIGIHNTVSPGIPPKRGGPPPL